MNETDQRNLFTENFKTTDPNSRKMNAQGHGLGLSIARKVAHFLGGRLTCTS
jgi:signal transduction histidine kinase